MNQLSKIVINKIRKIDNLTLEIDKFLKNNSTLGLNSIGNLITVKDKFALQKIVELFFKENIKYFILGGGSNSILTDRINPPIIKLKFPLTKSMINQKMKSFILPASASTSVVIKQAITFNLKGFDCLAGIPGTIGGATYMNAGNARGDISKLIKKIRVIKKNGQFFEYSPKKTDFAYRKNKIIKNGDIIYEVELKNLGQDKSISKTIKKDLVERKIKQPIDKKTCGSLFKNKSGDPPCLAAKYIDILGMKGFSVNDISISKKHANFLENRATATGSDVLSIINILEEELELNFGFSFELEAKIYDN